MELLSIFLLAITGALTLVAFFLVMDVFFAPKLAEIKLAAGEQTGRALLIGLVNFLFFGALGVALVALAENFGIQFLAIPALLIAILLAVGILFGLGAVSHLIGERLFPEAEPRRQKTWGAGVLILACLTPYAGWFGMLPFTALLGLGALIQVTFRRKRNALAEA